MSGARKNSTLTATGSIRTTTASSGDQATPSSTIVVGCAIATATGSGVRLTVGLGLATSLGAGPLITTGVGSITITTGAGPRAVTITTSIAVGGGPRWSSSSPSAVLTARTSAGIRSATINPIRTRATIANVIACGPCAPTNSHACNAPTRSINAPSRQ